MADERSRHPDGPPTERYYTEHVQASPDRDADNELLRANINEKQRREWRLVSMMIDPDGESVELVWDTSGIS